VNDARPEALRRLDPLVGRWEVTVDIGPEPMRGRTDFAWQDGVHLVARSTGADGGPPDSIEVIGVDDTTGQCQVLYTDNRGVHRIYSLSIEDGVWRQWRDVPDFAQRFTGTFADDGDTVHAKWETCTDGETWEHDFDLTYRRQR
jgi:hypothetical protein